MVMRGRLLIVEHLRPGAVSQLCLGVKFEAMTYKVVTPPKAS